MNDDFCPGIKLIVSDPIIPFRESIINKKLLNKVSKKTDNFKDVDDESSSEEE